ncbi:MAG TPA: hypothetical protein VK816_04395 [Jatrophihabitantaceae bacterium]|jgi:hypothetical protein|nr:hypothetical protein [Jatrophihabitantaceae bacterium]
MNDPKPAFAHRTVVSRFRLKVAGAVIAATLTYGGGLIALSAVPAHSATTPASCSITAQDQADVAFVTQWAHYLNDRSGQWDADLGRMEHSLVSLHESQRVSDADFAQLSASYNALGDVYNANAALVNEVKHVFGSVEGEYQHILGGAFDPEQEQTFREDLLNLQTLLREYFDSPDGHVADRAATANITNWFNNELVPAVARQGYTLAPMPLS